MTADFYPFYLADAILARAPRSAVVAAACAEAEEAHGSPRWAAAYERARRAVVGHYFPEILPRLSTPIQWDDLGDDNRQRTDMEAALRVVVMRLGE